MQPPSSSCQSWGGSMAVSETSQAWKKPLQSPMSSTSSTTTGLPQSGSSNCLVQRIAPVARSMPMRSEEHTSELQSLMRISYAVFCLKKKNKNKIQNITHYADIY